MRDMRDSDEVWRGLGGAGTLRGGSGKVSGRRWSLQGGAAGP